MTETSNAGQLTAQREAICRLVIPAIVRDFSEAEPHELAGVVFGLLDAATWPLYRLYKDSGWPEHEARDHAARSIAHARQEVLRAFEDTTAERLADSETAPHNREGERIDAD